MTDPSTPDQPARAAASGLDAQTRAKLRRSLVLQCIAAVAMTVALVARASSFGWDVPTVLLAIAVVIIAGSALWTWSRLRTG